MDGYSIPSAIAPVLCVMVLLAIGSLVIDHDYAGNQPPADPPLPSSDGHSDGHWTQTGATQGTGKYRRIQVRDKATAAQDARQDLRAEAIPADLPVVPAIQLPWIPERRYRYYCVSRRQYYPDVSRCPADWQVISLVSR